MLFELWNVIAPVLVCTAIGVFWGRSSTPYAAEFVSRAVMNIGAPCLIVSTISQAEISGQGFAQVALAASLIFIGTAALAVLVIRYSGGDVRSLLSAVVFPNNGNMGLPLCLFAFGEEGLALALAFFLVQMTALMTGGVALMSRANTGLVSMLRDLAKQPLIGSIFVALWLLGTDTTLPLWIDSTVELLAGFTIPLMLITLGVSLSNLTTTGWWRSIGFSVLRIGGGLAFAWIVVSLLGLTGTVKNVVLLQSIMPAAVFNYLLALKFDRDPNAVAGIVVASTVMALVAVPLLLALLL
ncbi:MAG: AEC family transporter [Porticoccus sp.]|nr:AEC family transporter [Porticoccus sp.]MBQ0807371.1 AEC family transporter [Porticoccus sp.]